MLVDGLSAIKSYREVPPTPKEAECIKPKLSLFFLLVGVVDRF